MLEGFGQKVTGLSLVQGKTPDQSLGALRGTLFFPNRATEIVCFVSGSRILLRCDGGRRNWSWSGPPESVELDSRYWTGIPADRISLAVPATDTRFRIGRAVLEPLAPGEVPAAIAPFPVLPLPNIPRPPPLPPIPRPGLGNPFGPLVDAAAGLAQDALPSPTSPAEPAPPEAERRKESVCLIETPSGSGSGFVLGERIIATNAHVTDDAFADEIKLVFGAQRSQTFQTMRILYEDRLRDICLLEATVAAPPIPLVADYEMKRGDRVVIIGNPALGKTGIVLRDAVTTGRISALVHTKGCDFYQIHAEISPGNSGGPVLNWEG